MYIKSISILLLFVAANSYSFLAGYYRLPPCALIQTIKQTVSPRVQPDCPVSPWLAEKGPLYEIPVPRGSTVIIGDSLVQNGNWDELMPGMKIVNRGLGYDTVHRLPSRIPRHIRGRPDRIVVLCGVNDLSFGRTPAMVEEDYRRVRDMLIGIVRPHDLLMVSILPCGPEKASLADVQDCNARIKRLAEGRGCRFADLYPLFLRGGRADGSLYIADHVHLSAAGYRMLSDALRKTL